MIEREEVVAALVAAAPDKQLVGRVRLQKVAYLLEQLGLERNLAFEYYHYGPYSRGLDNAVGDAKVFGLVSEEFRHRQSDGAMFSIFKLNENCIVEGAVYGKLGREKVSSLIEKFSKTNVTVLELAATIDWLWRRELISDWKSEIKKRKGQKVQAGRLDKAVDLLKSLDLSPPLAQPHA